MRLKIASKRICVIEERQGWYAKVRLPYSIALDLALECGVT
jgi:hypothetical protein